MEKEKAKAQKFHNNKLIKPIDSKPSVLTKNPL